MKKTIILLTVLAIWGCLWYVVSEENTKPSEEGKTLSETQSKKMTKKVKRKLPDDIQLVDMDIEAVLTDTVKKMCQNTQNLIIWPSSEEIEKKIAKKDRTQDLPPFYPFNGEKMTEEQRKEMGLFQISLAPERALKGAQAGINEMLKEEWIPDDLDKWLLPIADKDPKKSKVICRFEVEDNKIQIIQLKWFTWITIVPSKSLIQKEMSSEQLINMVFKTFFTKGGKMEHLPKETILGADKKIVSYKVDFSSLFKNNMDVETDYWWCWIMCYTDNKSVCIFTKNNWQAYSHTPTLDEPWF